MRLRFTIRDLLEVTAFVAVAASMVRTSHWFLAIGFCIAVIAAIVAMKVQEPPDPRFLRVAIFLAIAFAAATLVLHVDYLRTNIRSHRDGHAVDGIHVHGSGLSDEEVRAICDVVARSSNGGPVLWMEHAEQDNVEVFTGEVRGPLDGGGRIFILKKIDGVWTLIDDGKLRSWVS